MKPETKLQQIYVISGDEILLRQEALEKIITQAKTEGFTEHLVFDNSLSNCWDDFSNQLSARSLFGDKTILDCRIHNNKPGTQGEKALKLFIDKKPADKLLIVSTAKVTMAQQKTAWYQQLTKNRSVINLWPMNQKQFPQWLKQRLQTKNLTVSPEALQLLADQLENNLLASQQMIEKLSLIYGSQPKTLTTEEVLSCLTTHARYTIFDLANAVQQKQLPKIVTILNYLQAEGIETPLVLWALTRECRKLKLEHLLSSKAFDTDQMIKGIQSGNTWDNLQQLCFQMAGRSLFQEQA